MAGIFNFMRKPKKHNFEVTVEQLERAALIIDQDCWITMYHREGGFGFAMKFRRDDFVDIFFMHQLFGGYLGKQDVDGRIVYWLNIQAGRALSLMWAVDPYVKRRRKSFELIKLLRASIDANRQRKLSQEEKDHRVRIVTELNALNKAFFEWRKTHDPLDFTDLEKRA